MLNVKGEQDGGCDPLMLIRFDITGLSSKTSSVAKEVLFGRAPFALMSEINVRGPGA